MKSHRPLLHALPAALLIAAAGCRTAGVNNMPHTEILPHRTALSAAELLSDHNRNAELVQSLEARPSVSGSNRSRLLPGAGGRLALERPRNFRLQISAGMQEIADIGSNDDEFWFWFKESPDKAVYYANYDESGASPLAAGLQPDWIIEAMGLRVIPDDELARMKVTAGKEPDTLVITHRDKTPRGVEFLKEIILSESTHRIREQRVYTADRKSLLARAVVTGYDKRSANSGPDGPSEEVILPKKLRLELTQDKLALDVSMSEVQINKLEPTRRAALFFEPHFAGFARKNLAEEAGVATSSAPARSGSATLGAPTSIRETIPAPPPRVRLNDPSPLGIDGARRTRRDPAPLAADLPSSYAQDVEEVVGAPIPRGSDDVPQAVEARNVGRNSLANGVER